MTQAIRRAPRLASALAGAALTAAILMPLVWRAGLVSAQGAAPPAQVTTHFVVFEREDTGIDREIDLGEKGFGSGDMDISRHSIYDPSTKKKIGTDAVVLQIIQTIGDNDGIAMVNAAILLREGHIQVQGTLRFSQFESNTVVLPVTGGTGAYAHTSGTVRPREGSLGGHHGTYLTFDITKNA